MKRFLLLVLLLTLPIGACTNNAHQEQAGLPPPAHTSTTTYPTSATRMDVICRQPDALKTNVCEAFRYSDFGGSH